MISTRFNVQQLLAPAAYPWPVDEVELIETHISWVFLAGDRVVKLKRPVDLGFVDFRDPATRKQACEDEVRLNKRLTEGIYLGVIPVTANGVDAPGEPLAWATLMRRLPAGRMLDILLKQGTAPANLAELLADRLIPFHSPLSSSSQPPVILNEVKDLSRSGVSETPPALGKPLIHQQASAHPRGEILRFAQNDKGGAQSDKGGNGDGEGDTPEAGLRATKALSSRAKPRDLLAAASLPENPVPGSRDSGRDACPPDPDVYLNVLTDNLAQVAEAAGDILGPGQLAAVDRSMRAYMDNERDLLHGRFQTWLREGHGDLRCEHVCLEDDLVQIFDCVEFEIAIRCADVASDLAFLLMDLRRLGAPSVAEELLERYRAARFDLPRSVIDLYAAHRALVRAKVAALERSGNDPERDLASAFEAASYLDIATSFACPTPPMLVLVSGLSGSGKSTVAAAIERATGGTVLASDRVRKELAGMEPSEGAAAEWHQGIYTDDWTTRTYDRLLDMASDEFDRGHTAVVDATFLDNEQRARFSSAAQARGLPAVIVWTELDDRIARQRIERRAREGGSPSDATVAIRQRQQQPRETPLRVPAGAMAVTIDTGREGPVPLDPFFTALQTAGLIGTLQRNRPETHG